MEQSQPTLTSVVMVSSSHNSRASGLSIFLTSPSPPRYVSCTPTGGQSAESQRWGEGAGHANLRWILGRP
eukprot:1159245-Pelagomonas_calceolata.AAC.8